MHCPRTASSSSQTLQPPTAARGRRRRGGPPARGTPEEPRARLLRAPGSWPNSTRVAGISNGKQLGFRRVQEPRRQVDRNSGATWNASGKDSQIRVENSRRGRAGDSDLEPGIRGRGVETSGLWDRGGPFDAVGIFLNAA
jgi:hypothetical protein